MYYVYIISNKALKPLYIGVTNNLTRRIYEHKNKFNYGFSNKYNLNKLLFYEEFHYVKDAIGNEKKLKNWHREWKINLIKEKNPGLIDLAREWKLDPETSSG